MKKEKKVLTLNRAPTVVKHFQIIGEKMSILKSVGTDLHAKNATKHLVSIKFLLGTYVQNIAMIFSARYARNALRITLV